MPDPKLYVIATPLGNRNDITLRALEQLRALDTLFAEDTREVTKLLELHGISSGTKNLHSYASHNMREATEKAIGIMGKGTSIGFVSDRGTPGVSDPGPMLVAAATAAGFGVEPVPGPSSVTTVLSVAGVSADRFLFLGFLPTARGSREETYEMMKTIGAPTCFFESPRRVKETVTELVVAFPGRRLFVGREMTKLHEQYEWITLDAEAPGKIMERGEFALVLDPGPALPETGRWEEEVRLRLAPDKEWAKDVAARAGLSASEVYNALQRLKNPRP